MTEKLHDARAVANEILLAAKVQGRELTIMQLLKLVYLCHGWSLAIFDRPLISDEVQAWQYGPVIPTVYRAFNSVGRSPIQSLAVHNASGIEFREKFTEDEHDVINAVVKHYGKMHAFQLSDIMHQPGTPWTLTYNSAGPYQVIPTQLISDHFKKLRDGRQSTNGH